MGKLRELVNGGSTFLPQCKNVLTTGQTSDFRIQTTSPTDKVQDFPECFRLCLSLRLWMYSFDLLFHIASFAMTTILALRRRSMSVM